MPRRPWRRAVRGEIQRDRHGEDAEGVIQVRRWQLAAERPPPRANVDRPQPRLERLVHLSDEPAQDLGRRLGGGWLRGPPTERSRRSVAADPDVAVALLVGHVRTGDSGDLHVPARRGEAAGDAQPPRIGSGGVRDEEDRPSASHRQARADQPAPSRRTWRGRSDRPRELSTVSTTSSARSKRRAQSIDRCAVTTTTTSEPSTSSSS